MGHDEFVEKFKKGEITVLVNRGRAGDFVMSPLANKYNKPAHLFWSWVGTILTIPLPIVLLFLSDWPYAVGSFFSGLMVTRAARKSAEQFVLQNIVDNEDFYTHTLLHGGAILADKEGKPLKN